jgi:hypothetical protein
LEERKKRKLFLALKKEAKVFLLLEMSDAGQNLAHVESGCQN